MKILMIIEDLRSGGKERRFVELVKRLKEHPDIKINVVLMGKIIHYSDFVELYLPTHFIIRRIKKDPLVFTSIYKLCKKIKPDIIHSWGSMPTFYAIPSSKILNIKLLNGMITDAPPIVKYSTQKFFNFLFKFSDMILSNSRSGLISYNAPKDKSHVISNGFNLKRLNDIEDTQLIREKFKIRTKYIVGMVGSFSIWKDYPTYLSAAMYVLSKRDDVSFLAIGEGENLESCRQLIKTEYKDFIIFTGSQEKIESIVNIFNIGVLTSLNGEGISNSIMEYMALGKPVLATHCGGNEELVIDQKTGFLIKTGDSKELAEKINFLLDNPKIASCMGSEGKAFLLDNFSIDKMVKKTSEIYTRLLNPSEKNYS